MKFLLPFAILALGGQTTLSSRAGFSIPGTSHKGTVSIVADIVVTNTGGTGTLTYAAEDHNEHDHAAGMYPHLVVNMRRFDSVTLTGNVAEIKGYGRLHEDSVKVTAIFTDNQGTGKPDRFEIVCQKDGHNVYQRAAAIETGDIKIRREP